MSVRGIGVAVITSMSAAHPFQPKQDVDEHRNDAVRRLLPKQGL